MRYEELKAIDRAEAEWALASGDSACAARAILRLALHDPDWRWVQTRCLELLERGDDQTRRAAATSLGHLARLHRAIDTEQVLPALRRHLADPSIAGTIEDALDDIARFVRDAVP